MSLTDQQYVQFCLDGRPEMFRLLVERYQSALVGILRYTMGNLDEAEEVAQEAFVRAYSSLGKLRKAESFFPWLLGIANRVAKENLRAASRTQPLVHTLAEVEAPATPQESDVATTVGEAVGGLPEIYRNVVVLRYYGGRSCQEIGRELGLPLGTVTKRLSRAYALLRERFGPAFSWSDDGGSQ